VCVRARAPRPRRCGRVGRDAGLLSPPPPYGGHLHSERGWALKSSAGRRLGSLALRHVQLGWCGLVWRVGAGHPGAPRLGVPVGRWGSELLLPTAPSSTWRGRRRGAVAGPGSAGAGRRGSVLLFPAAPSSSCARVLEVLVPGGGAASCCFPPPRLPRGVTCGGVLVRVLEELVPGGGAASCCFPPPRPLRGGTRGGCWLVGPPTGFGRMRVGPWSAAHSSF
jgi:hypothetical protein